MKIKNILYIIILYTNTLLSMNTIKIGTVLKAIKNHDNETVINFLEQGNDVEYTDPWENRTLLGWCASRDNLELTKYLVEVKNANINAADKNGNTPLILAAKSKNLKILQYLIERKADLEATDNLEWTALMWACIGTLPLVEELIKNGANINATDQLGNIPYTISLRHHKTAIANFLHEKLVQQNKIIDEVLGFMPAAVVSIITEDYMNGKKVKNQVVNTQKQQNNYINSLILFYAFLFLNAI